MPDYYTLLHYFTCFTCDILLGLSEDNVNWWSSVLVNHLGFYISEKMTGSNVSLYKSDFTMNIIILRKMSKKFTA